MIFRGETIQGTRLRKARTVTLGRRTVVRYPRWPLSAGFYMEVTTRRFTLDGVQWPRGSWSKNIR